ncbi:helix-turn-helix domain-containing protein [Adhaeribacter pallidiroseus]|uniref:Transposase n=1 Tax=Adhaeribacter pallidiroseus TaxID=2072847 RepID=A0A369QF02_9BACT|nr:helix-turn-helix domain-containing protein [Adhaeribacter pallidiroseus]RDC62890.1 hypothetical protein AHMF7616_01489 [Adhaeribacter pallidiroseus]
MRYIKGLTPEQKQALEQGHKMGKSYRFRNRCQAILLSAAGYSVQELAAMFQVADLSIYQWFNRFEARGVTGLQNQSGQGRKPLLKLQNQAHVQVVEEQLEKENKRLKLAKAQIEQQLGQSLSESTLKRFLKKLVTAGNASASG